jgi:hypothetical protein
MRLKLFYTAILVLGMSAFASSNERAWHCREIGRGANPAKGAPVTKPLMTEKDAIPENPLLGLALYV